MPPPSSSFPASTADDNRVEQTLELMTEACTRRANFWMAVIVVLIALLYVIGVVAVFVTSVGEGFPWIGIPLAMVTVALVVDAARHKRDAEMLLRRFEHWLISGNILLPEGLDDFYRKLPKKLPPAVEQWVAEGARLPAPSANAPRSLKILSERTWLSHHFADFLARKLEFVFWAMLGVALGLMIFSAVTLSSSSSVSFGAAKCVAATLLFVLSGAALYAWRGFQILARRCRDINQEGSLLAKTETLDTSDVQRLWTEYQIARAEAPLIHPWTRRFIEAQLEDEFQSFLRDGERWRDRKTGRYLDSLDNTPDA